MVVNGWEPVPESCGAASGAGGTQHRPKDPTEGADVAEPSKGTAGLGGQGL